MSEINAVYALSGRINSLSRFTALACCKPMSSGNYEAPTCEVVSDLIRVSGWTEFAVCQITGVRYDNKKGSSTVRRWHSGGGPSNISYANWRLLVEAAGVSDTSDTLEFLT